MAACFTCLYWNMTERIDELLMDYHRGGISKWMWNDKR